MTQFNKHLTMDALFRNPQLKHVLPQFPRNQALRNVYSFAEITRRVKVYLRGTLGGRNDPETEGLLVRGKHSAVLKQVEQLAVMLEQFFSAVPQVVKNIRQGTPLYTPYSSVAEIKGMKGKAGLPRKTELMQCVLDNINYNPEFNSLNSVTKYPPRTFDTEQLAWLRKVGYKVNRK